MKKNIYIILLLMILLMTSCSVKINKAEHKSEEYVTSNLPGKYNIDDDILTTIYFGTVFKKDIYHSDSDNYKVRIMIFNWEEKPKDTNLIYYYYPEKYESVKLIAEFDDFYYENYPLIIKKHKTCSNFKFKNIYDYEPESSIAYNIDKSLFLGESGTITLVITCVNSSTYGISYKYTINENIISIKEG